MNETTLPPGSPNPALDASCSPAIPDGILAVIFDFDGTLADTMANQEQSLRAALQPYGLDLDTDWYRRHFGLSIHDLLAALPGARQLPHDEIIRRSRAHLLAHMHTITPSRAASRSCTRLAKPGCPVPWRRRPAASSSIPESRPWA
ncbi:HAD hydrolase-like protein [Streptomyces sp. FXJ1.4098]|nr:HAD hydrolase-like protein [Streptomyces sp. FXJ1.4098]